MGKGKFKQRLEIVESRVSYYKYRIDEVNKRIDRLIELVTEHDQLLDVMRDNRDKSEAK